MFRTVMIAGAVGLTVAVGAQLEAQAKPSFAGTWTIVVDSAAANTDTAAAAAGGARGGRGGRGGGGGGDAAGAARGGRGGGGFAGRGGRGRGLLGGGLGGEQATIAQDERTLTITSDGPTGSSRRVYNLDGTESTNMLAVGQQSIEQKSTAKWDANKLVITTTINFNGNAIETTMSLSLDATGNLVVESTGAGFGGRGRGGAAGAAATPQTVRTVYKKAM